MFSRHALSHKFAHAETKGADLGLFVRARTFDGRQEHRAGVAAPETT
jgi:hypothetical protein